MNSIGLRFSRKFSATNAKQTLTVDSLQQTLQWKQFFAMRRSRRIVEQTTSICFGMAGLSAGSYYFLMVRSFDPTESILGLPDPTIAYFLGAFAAGVGGALVGNLSATGIWRVLQKTGTLKHFDAREKEFFKRIAKYRPKEISLARLVGQPQTAAHDYYGEKIYSVADFRAWIRKQRRIDAANKANVFNQ